MPNAKVLESKQAIVEKLSETLAHSAAGVFVDYRGINVADDTALRADLRAAGIDYTVIKNTLTLRAAEKAGLDDLESVLKGPTAMAVHSDDAIVCAKKIVTFAKKNPKFVVKAGFADGKTISADDVKTLAALSSKEGLYAQVLGTMLAPVTSLAIVLNQICEKKSV